MGGKPRKKPTPIPQGRRPAGKLEPLQAREAIGEGTFKAGSSRGPGGKFVSAIDKGKMPVYTKHERLVGWWLEQRYGKNNVVSQVDIIPHGRSDHLIVDFVVRNPETGTLEYYDAKTTEKASKYPQNLKYRALYENGGTVRSSNDRLPSWLENEQELEAGGKIEKVRKDNHDLVKIKNEIRSVQHRSARNRSVSNRGLESNPTKPKQSLSPDTNTPSTPTLPTNTTPSPDIDTKIKGSRIRLPKGLIVDLIVEFTIGAIISDFEQQIAKLTQEAIKRAWADKVYKIVQPQIEAFIGLERDAREEIKVEKAYIEVDWEVLLREQAEDFADAVVWFFKFSYGKPGFVELFEDVNYISHRLVWYSQDRQKPRRRRDKDDDTLIHEQHRQYILIWDEKIHLIAEMYRKIAHEALVRLDIIHEKIKKVKNTLSTQAQSDIDQHLLRGDLPEIANALYINNFKEATRQSRMLIHGIRGQFSFYKVLSHHKRGVIEEVKVLQEILANSLTVYLERTKSLEQDEKNLLSMFLGQRLENLQ